jgi:hypothetical protein
METTTPAPSGLNVFSRILNVFVSPSRTFDALIAKPDWLTPVLVMVMLFLAAGIPLSDLIQKEQAKAARAAIMKSDRIPEDRREQIADQQVEMMKRFWVVGFVIGIAVVMVLYFIGALFLWFGGNLMGRKVPYMVVLSVLGYSLMIDIAASAVKVPLMAVKQSLRIDTGLGLLIPDTDLTSPLYVFLSKFDLFTFWQLSVLVIGLSMVYKFSTGKSVSLVAGLWLLWVLVQTGLAAVGIRFS